jgi:DNA replication protein
MKNVPGLPARMDYCAVPNYYLNVVMPSVDNLEELKVSLHIFRIASRKKGRLQYISRDELLADPAIIECLKKPGHTPEASLDSALSKALERGIIFAFSTGAENSGQDLYALNTPSNREAVKTEKIVSPPRKTFRPEAEAVEEMPNIFACYEENIGLLTPLIADELREAEKIYTAEWIMKAIREAVINNKRNWRYISKILERWLTEGKTHGAHRQNYQADDPSKYTTGEYQQFAQR